MPYNEDPYSVHVQNVKALERQGVKPPAEWVKAHQRHTDYQALQFSCRERLVAAVVNDEPDDVGMWRALAIAEAADRSPSQGQPCRQDSAAPQTHRAAPAARRRRLQRSQEPIRFGRRTTGRSNGRR